MWASLCGAVQQVGGNLFIAHMMHGVCRWCTWLHCTVCVVLRMCCMVWCMGMRCIGVDGVWRMQMVCGVVRYATLRTGMRCVEMWCIRMMHVNVAHGDEACVLGVWGDLYGDELHGVWCMRIVYGVVLYGVWRMGMGCMRIGLWVGVQPPISIAHRVSDLCPSPHETPNVDGVSRSRRGSRCTDSSLDKAKALRARWEEDKNQKVKAAVQEGERKLKEAVQKAKEEAWTEWEKQKGETWEQQKQVSIACSTTGTVPKSFAECIQPRRTPASACLF